MKKFIAILVSALLLFTLVVPVTKADAAVSFPILKKGTSGTNVKTLQYALNANGAGLVVDGDFGAGSEVAVKNFQTTKGLVVDGIVGQATWNVLLTNVQLGSKGDMVKALQIQLVEKYGYNITVDGDFGPATEAAVLNYKNKNNLTGGSVVGLTTWQYLLSGGRSTWTYPLESKALQDPTTSDNYFGSGRSGGRAHAGIDFHSYYGTKVLAITGGTVIDKYYFYDGTYAVEIRNDDGSIFRYGEIESSIVIGSRVNQGDQVGTVGRLISIGQSMLHLEYYKGTVTGALTNTNNYYYPYVTDLNYQRRSDLLDPTFVNNLPMY